MANRAVGRSLTDILRSVEARLDGVRDEFLKNVAKDLTDASPVDTGYYVMSHQISEQSLAGRFTGNFNSIGPGNQNQELFRETAYNNLVYSIEALPKEATKIFIGNTAPHANLVEHGSDNWRNKDGHQVYKTTKNRFPLSLSKAVAKVKGEQR